MASGKQGVKVVTFKITQTRLVKVKEAMEPDIWIAGKQ
jgi:hypothetical protein